LQLGILVDLILDNFAHVEAMPHLQMTTEVLADVVWVSVWVSDANGTHARQSLVPLLHMVKQTLPAKVALRAERAAIR
jgi:hypothetical protein